MPPAAGARRPPCPSFTPVGRRVTRGMRYAADPPTVEEIVMVMRRAGDSVHGR
jgi:hypothetical protein